MADVAVRKVKDLPVEARQAVAELVGRQLRDEEQVSVRVSTPHPAPPLSERRRAASRLEKIINRAADKASKVPESELEGLIDEAMGKTRRRKR